MEAEILRDFSLNAIGASVMISLQNEIISNDLLVTQNNEIYPKKIGWQHKWFSLVENGLKEMNKNLPQSEHPSFLFKDKLQKAIDDIKKDRTQAGLILLETVAFHPYFSFNNDKNEKTVKINRDRKKESLKNISKKLGFPEDMAHNLGEQMKSTLNSMTGKWTKIGIASLAGLAIGVLSCGVAAPFIGGIVGGTMGLSGAAATMAGLAAIGGGSIAAGGLGVAGGTAILVGGGALLGMGTGFSSGHFIHTVTKKGVVFQAVKLEVALKEFVLQGQYDWGKAQEVLFKQRWAIECMEKEIDRLRLEGEEDNKRIKELEKIVQFLKEALKRNQDIFKERKVA